MPSHVGMKKNAEKMAGFRRPLPPVLAEGEQADKRIPFRKRSYVMKAKDITMKYSFAAKALTIAAVAALALALVPGAMAAERPCSNATLNGAFADRDTGLIAGLGQFVGANLEKFDGHGNMSSTGTVSLNGDIVQATATGTYTVNADCTGTYTLQNSLGLTIHAFFVIADGGDELEVVITDPGTVISCVARKQFPKGRDADE